MPSKSRQRRRDVEYDRPIVAGGEGPGEWRASDRADLPCSACGHLRD